MRQYADVLKDHQLSLQSTVGGIVSRSQGFVGYRKIRECTCGKKFVLVSYGGDLGDPDYFFQAMAEHQQAELIKHDHDNS